MKRDFIQPFVSGASSVLRSVLGQAPREGEIVLQRERSASKQINIICGVTGPVSGHLMYGMSRLTGDRIASVMVGKPVLTCDELAASAIAELANMISGRGLQALHDAGHVCDISPPIIIRGTQVTMNHLDVPAVVVPFTTQHGGFFVTVGLYAVA